MLENSEQQFCEEIPLLSLAVARAGVGVAQWPAASLAEAEQRVVNSPAADTPTTGDM